MKNEEKLIEQGCKKGYQQGLEDGVHEGVILGRQEGKKEVARQLLTNGVDRAIVKMSTGLSDDELASLFDDGR